MKFVSKNLAIKLKEKGFFEACFGCYYIKNPIGEVRKIILHESYRRGQNYQALLKWHVETREQYATANIALAPTIEQALKWLREEKSVYINVNALPSVCKNFMIEPDNRLVFDVRVSYVKEGIFNYYDLDVPYLNYEDACIAGIEYVVEHLI